MTLNRETQLQSPRVTSKRRQGLKVRSHLTCERRSEKLVSCSMSTRRQFCLLVFTAAHLSPSVLLQLLLAHTSVMAVGGGGGGGAGVGGGGVVGGSGGVDIGGSFSGHLQHLNELVDSYTSFCETETFNATCPPDHVILMTHARYGRMRLSRCVRLDYGHIGCSTDVLLAADGRCSGRRKCEIRVPDARFGENKPCPDDLKPYFEAGYTCVKVQTPPNQCPQTSDNTSTSSSSSSSSSSAHSSSSSSFNHLPVSSSSGVLASIVSDATGCGRSSRPWSIEVQSGQTIHVTLYDFGVHARRKAAVVAASQQQKHPPSPSPSPPPPPGVSKQEVVTVIQSAETFHNKSGRVAGSSLGQRGQQAAIIAPIITYIKDEGGTSPPPPPVAPPIVAQPCNGPTLALLWEPLALLPSRNVSVCGGVLRRQVSVHVTSTHRLEVALLHHSQQGGGGGGGSGGAGGGGQHYFLLQYQAVGCPDIGPFLNAWTVRKGDSAIIRCNYTKHVFHLKCIGNKWVGDMTNCTAPVGHTVDVGVERIQIVNMAIPYGTSIVIVLVIALTIGLLVLLAGLVCLRRQRHVFWTRADTGGGRAGGGEYTCDDIMTTTRMTGSLFEDDINDKYCMTTKFAPLTPNMTPAGIPEGAGRCFIGRKEGFDSRAGSLWPGTRRRSENEGVGGGERRYGRAGSVAAPLLCTCRNCTTTTYPLIWPPSPTLLPPNALYTARSPSGHAPPPSPRCPQLFCSCPASSSGHAEDSGARLFGGCHPVYLETAAHRADRQDASPQADPSSVTSQPHCLSVATRPVTSDSGAATLPTRLASRNTLRLPTSSLQPAVTTQRQTNTIGLQRVSPRAAHPPLELGLDRLRCEPAGTVHHECQQGEQALSGGTLQQKTERQMSIPEQITSSTGDTEPRGLSPSSLSTEASPNDSNTASQPDKNETVVEGLIAMPKQNNNRSLITSSSDNNSPLLPNYPGSSSSNTSVISLNRYQQVSDSNDVNTVNYRLYSPVVSFCTLPRRLATNRDTTSQVSPSISS